MISIGKQKGMTAIGWVFVFMLIALITLIMLKIMPIYLNSFTVKSSLASLEDERNIGSKSPKSIKKMLLKRFDVNMVTEPTKNDIYIEKLGGVMTVEVDYEVRKNLFGNLDVVVRVNESIEVPTN